MLTIVPTLLVFFAFCAGADALQPSFPESRRSLLEKAVATSVGAYLLQPEPALASGGATAGKYT